MADGRTSVVNIPGTDISFYLDQRLKKNIDEKIRPSLMKNDKDCVIAVDGQEGVGKSTLALQIGKYLDPTLDLSRVVFDADAFKEAIFRAKKGQCIIYDEAFTGLSSRSSLSGINRALVSLMMQMRQKNLFVIVVLPTFFLLDRYVALFRTKMLIHVYETGGRRGYFKIYNRIKKKRLYLLGKRELSYVAKLVKTRFKGRFYGVFALGDKKMEQKYRDKKAKALEDTQANPMTAGQIKYKEQRDLAIYLIRKLNDKSFQELEEMFLDYNMNISYVQISNICRKFGIGDKKILTKSKKETKEEEIDPSEDEIAKIEKELDEPTDSDDKSDGTEEDFDDIESEDDEKVL